MKSISDKVVQAGGGRSTVYYLLRELLQENDLRSFPIYRVDANGHARKIAQLFPVFPSSHYLVRYFPSETTNSERWTVYEALPWWLADMRPLGYLGRVFGNYLVERGEDVDPNPRTWHDDIVLRILTKYPKESIGNLLVGEVAYETWLQLEPDPILSLEEVSKRAESSEYYGSSAQGEQPKLLARLEEGKCIIKFSGHTSNTVAQRWADLLQAEAIASEVLNSYQQGIAAHNWTFSLHNRTFMASQRFDRIGEDGRVGVISLESLNGQFVGSGSAEWPEVMKKLENEGVVTTLAAATTEWIWAFGQLIANSDMHGGNLSVLVEQGRPYELAPVYDMLPMHFAPTPAGDLPSKPKKIKPHRDVSRVSWEIALPLAVEFWHKVNVCDAMSENMKQLAQKQLEQVLQFKTVISRMSTN